MDDSTSILPYDGGGHIELMTPSEVAKRLGMSNVTVLRRIADGDLDATTVGTHNLITLGEFERYRQVLSHRMAAASAEEIEAELFGENGKTPGACHKDIGDTGELTTSIPDRP